MPMLGPLAPAAALGDNLLHLPTFASQCRQVQRPKCHGPFNHCLVSIKPTFPNPLKRRRRSVVGNTHPDD